MSPRKTILRTLARSFHKDGADVLTRPADIDGFSGRPAEFQKAVNKLLQDRLIQGQPDAEGRLSIALNGHRLADIRKEIRPFWLRPGLWVAAAAIVVAVFGFVA